MNKYQIEYLAVWKMVLPKLLGWNSEQVELWAKPMISAMEPPGMLINEPPLYYVAREIVWRQESFEKLPRREVERQIRSIQSILSPNHSRSVDPDYDFELAKHQIGELFRGS